MELRRLLLTASLLLLASGAAAHGVVHTVTRERAVTVTATYHDGSPLAHAEAAVHAPDAERPFLHGRTDALGRLVFLPDRPGAWRVSIQTHDGHGLEAVVDIDGLDAPLTDARPNASPPGPGRLLRGLAGLVAIAAVTLLFLRTQRRTQR